MDTLYTVPNQPDGMVTFGEGRVVETALDFAERLLAVALLVLVSPLLAVLCLITRLTSRGPAFYSQVRVGRGGKPFAIRKLRSMVVDAETATGPVISWRGDPRITRWGGFLRASHLDELPQLWNVARGEMSFVGPRPERPEFVAEFERTIPGYAVRHRVKPGITGLAQVSAPYDAPAETKLTYDLIYVRNRFSPRLNLIVIRATVAKVLLRRTGQGLPRGA